MSVLDISYNSLEEAEVRPVTLQGVQVLEVLARMPELHVLTSTGNPIIRRTRDYRRTVLHK